MVSFKRVGLSAGAVLVLLVPTSARAADFHLYTCRTPTGVPAPTDGWSVSSGPGFAGVTSSCASGGFWGATLNPNTGVSTPGSPPNNIPEQPIVRAYWKSGDPNLVAKAAVLWRSAQTDSTPYVQGEWPNTYNFEAQKDLAASRFSPAGASLTPLEAYNSQNAGSPPYASFGTTVTPFDAANRVDTGPLAAPASVVSGADPALLVFLGCEGGLTCKGAAAFQIWAADLTVSDTSAPTVGAIGGDLVPDGNIGGTISGTKSAIVLGQDTGTGTYRAAVEVDGAIVASGLVPDPSKKLCAPQTAAGGTRGFTVLHPCPGIGNASVRWDTTGVADGPHKVRLLFEDAAGNQTVAAQGNVLVRNNPQTGPGSPIEFRGAANGQLAGADPGVVPDQAALSLVWPETAHAVSTRKSVVKRCAKSAKYVASHPVACHGKPAETAITPAWSKTKTSTLQGRLVDSQGQPITNASVALMATASSAGAQPTLMATVTTDANGGFTAAVPYAAGSRTVEARWTAHEGDTIPVATAAATVAVSAATGLTAPAKARPSQRITFSGTLRGTAPSMVAVPITLKVRNGGQWKTFATAATGPNGKWSAKVKFAKSRGFYTVRAEVGTVPTYPFAPGAGTRKVTIRVR